MQGVRRLLSRPRIYELFQSAVGSQRGRSTLVREYVRPPPGARVLDLGCGPGELVAYLGDVQYLGIDVSDEYIDRARRSFPQHRFRVGDATRVDDDLRGFDLVLAFGVLHHLDNIEASRFLAAAAAARAPGARFVSVDPATTADDRWAARMFIDRDRGRYVRSPARYQELAEAAFVNVKCHVRKDLLRIPYTHCVLECS